MNKAEEDLNEDLRLVGEKIKGALDYYRDQQADYEQKAAALHEAWDTWDLDALVGMGVITERDRDRLQKRSAPLMCLEIARSAVDSAIQALMRGDVPSSDIFELLDDAEFKICLVKDSLKL